MEPLRVITQTESWKSESQASTIAMLENWVQMAKAGEIISVAVVGEGADGLCQWEFTNPRRRTAFLGALMHVQWLVHESIERE